MWLDLVAQWDVLGLAMWVWLVSVCEADSCGWCLWLVQTGTGNPPAASVSAASQHCGVELRGRDKRTCILTFTLERTHTYSPLSPFFRHSLTHTLAY